MSLKQRGIDTLLNIGACFIVTILVNHVHAEKILTDPIRNLTLVSPRSLAALPARRDIVVKEGSSILIECKVTGSHKDILWYNSKGHVLGEGQGGGKWFILEDGLLNITSVAFEDRGRYTCIPRGAWGTSNYTVTLRVAYTYGGLGLYYVIVCLVAFSITMVLNVTRLCMVSSHLRKTERAINDFFRTEGADKLQKALEVAKRIPILTTAKTVELARVTQCKTMELARHMEELARSIPLPPLIMSCRSSTGEVAETGQRRAIGSPDEGASGEVNVEVSVHTGGSLEQEAEECASMLGTRSPTWGQGNENQII